jgi:hypothetical protein
LAHGFEEGLFHEEVFVLGLDSEEVGVGGTLSRGASETGHLCLSFLVDWLVNDGGSCGIEMAVSIRGVWCCCVGSRQRSVTTPDRDTILFVKSMIATKKCWLGDGDRCIEYLVDTMPRAGQ